MSRTVGQIKILLSAGVVFDFAEATRIADECGHAEYVDYMRGRGIYEKDHDPELMGRKLAKGPLWDFVTTLLQLNEIAPGTVEIGIVCKGAAEAAIPIFRNLDVSGLAIPYRIVVPGNEIRMADHEAFGTDLYLSCCASDTQCTIDHGVAAATINFSPSSSYQHDGEILLNLWLDGDAVTFGSSSEVVFRKEGLEKWRTFEFNRFSKPIEPGPFTGLLVKISKLNSAFPKGKEPIQLSLLTARGDKSAAHALMVAEKLGINFNGGLYFVDGTSKADVLKAHKPDLFFDDQQAHLQDVTPFCPTGHVAYPTGSPMYDFLLQEEKDAGEKAPPPKPKFDQ